MEHRLHHLTALRLMESRWTAFVVSLLVVILLGLFYRVVHGAAQAGVERKQAVVARTLAVSHCKALPNWNDSSACLRNLKDKHNVEAQTLLAAQ